MVKPVFTLLLAMASAITALLVPLEASAQGRQLFGARDFEMDWSTSGGKTLRVRYLAAAKRVRLEALDGSGEAMVKDLARGDVFVLVAEGQRGVYAAKAEPMRGLNGNLTERVREIAGEKCRDMAGGSVTLCLSDDGIPLVVEENGQILSATRIVRQAQSPALFQPPKDAKMQPMPGRGANSLPKLPF